MQIHDETYAVYKSTSADGNLRLNMPLCIGLVLVPDGPGTWQRVGIFENIHRCEFDDVAEQEVTIV